MEQKKWYISSNAHSLTAFISNLYWSPLQWTKKERMIKWCICKDKFFYFTAIKTMAANCLGFLLASVITLPLNKIKPTLFRARGNGTFIKVARNSSESYGLFCSFVTLKLNYTTVSLHLSSLLMPSHMAGVCSSKQGRTSWKIFCLFLFLSPEVFVVVGVVVVVGVFLFLSAASEWFFKF